MIERLSEHPVLIAPVGGESVRLLQGLAPAWSVDLVSIEIDQASPAYVHDRRSGERKEFARSRTPLLDRPEIDELYGRVFTHATKTGTCVITGRSPDDSLDPDFYRRLAADLASTHVAAIGDLHGQELAAFLNGGPLHTLKVSDEDVVEDKLLAPDATFGDRLNVANELMDRGVQRVVISSDVHPTVGRSANLFLKAESPVLQSIDSRGSGDAMTAGLVMAALRGLKLERSLQIACATGAANVTRHGLARFGRESLVPRRSAVDMPERIDTSN